MGSKVSGKLPTLKPMGKVCNTQGFLSANVRFASSKRLMTSWLETGSLSFLRVLDKVKGCTLMCEPDKLEAKKCSEFFPSNTWEIWFIASEIAAVVLLILTISPFNTLLLLPAVPVAKISNLPRSFCFPAMALTKELPISKPIIKSLRIFYFFSRTDIKLKNLGLIRK